MGIKGIYQQIGPGQRIALSKLAVETFEQKGRPLRLAIDISIWLFQIQSSKGGTNPALRTFYYRLLRLITLSIHPLFVFDGPNKPPFKRNKRTGPNVASIPEFLAKQLLKQFGLPFHIAPGEAEAECALLQRKGMVDAVLSEDVDTLMFGSGLTLRNWSAEGSLSNKTPTHVNVYDSVKTKEGAGMDREGMILVALMSGGDYVPEGIPGCGPKTACQAAKAGFGKDLCAIAQDDDAGLAAWKDRLKHELVSNESKHFQRKAKALVIPEDFPRRDILRYYTHPCLSSDKRLEKLAESLKWEQDIDFAALRTFTEEAFEWICLSGAKKFIRNLAPALLVKELRCRGESGTGLETDDSFIIAKDEARLIKSIHKRRNHVNTDGSPELRVDFIPHSLVPIDLDAEDPDPELPMDGLQSDDDAFADIDAGDGEPSSPRKRRGPSTYDPTKLEKIWIMETYVKVGVPLKVQDWEESFRNAKKYEAMKASRKRLEKVHNSPKKSKPKGGRSVDALSFTKVTKPGLGSQAAKSRMPDAELVVDDSSEPQPLRRKTPQLNDAEDLQVRTALENPSTTLPFSPLQPSQRDVVNLLSSSPQRLFPERTTRRSNINEPTLIKKPYPRPPRNQISPPPHFEPLLELPASVTKRRKRSPLRRAQTVANPSSPQDPFSSSTPRKRPTSSLSFGSAIAAPASPSPSKRRISTTRRAKVPTTEVISLTSSPFRAPPLTPRHQRLMTPYLSPSPTRVPPSTPRSQRLMTQYLSPSPTRPKESRPLAAAAVPLASNAQPFSAHRLDEPDAFLGPPAPAAQFPSVNPLAGAGTKEAFRRKVRNPLGVSSTSVINAAETCMVISSDNVGEPTRAELKIPVFRRPLLSSPRMLRSASSVRQTSDAHSFLVVDQTTHVHMPFDEEDPFAEQSADLSRTTDPIHKPRQPKTIRIRDSVAGTWALDAPSPNAGDPSLPASTAEEAAQKKRKALGTDSPAKGGKARGKRWRVSRVEVLDLTGP